MHADRSRSVYDPKISPPSAGGRVACPPDSATGTTHASTQWAREDGGDEPAAPPQQSFKEVSRLIAEMKEYAAYYVAAKVDSLKVTFRNLGVYSVLGIVGLIAGSAFVTTASVLVLAGAALGLGRLFSPVDDPYKFFWLGALLVGLVFFTTIGLGTWLGLKKMTSTAKKSLVQKYEQRQNWERGQFGHNVSERATQSTAK